MRCPNKLIYSPDIFQMLWKAGNKPASYLGVLVLNIAGNHLLLEY